MAATIERLPNPFSTRWIRTGAVPYLFPLGLDPTGVLEKLRQANWRGAVVGPHGSGKSTLLATLIPEIEKFGFEVEHVVLHRGDCKVPAGSVSSDRLKRSGRCLSIIDGFEQLSWWRRRRIASHCRKSASGLIVTAHDDRAAFPLPVAFRTAGELCVLEHIVSRHLPPCDDWIDAEDLEEAFNQHHGNVRNALFALYDLFELRRRRR